MRPLGTQWLKTVMRDGGPLSVIILAHLSLVIIHFQHLWRTGLHVHFPLILTAAGGLLWSRWYGKRIPTRWQVFVSGILLVCGFLFLLFGVLIWSPWLGYCGALVTGFAVLLRACPAPVKEFFPAWLLLWLLVPLPIGLDRHLSLELQSLSSRAASLLLDFFQVNHLQTGNMIEVPGMRFAVEEACSGIHSLFVFIAAAAILAVVLRHWWLRAIALIASSVVWAVAANMVRIAGVVIAASQFGLDLSTGWRHELWGIVLFGIACGMILSTDQILWLLFGSAEERHDRRDEEGDDDAALDGDTILPEPGIPLSTATAVANEFWDDEGDHSPPRLGILQSWTVAGMFACLGLVQSMPRSTNQLLAGAVPAISLTNLGEETLPAELAGWRRKKFETEKRGPGNTHGEFSAIWRYEHGDREAVVSLDYPFDGWHQVTECYLARGCRVLKWQLEPLSADPFAACDLPPAVGKLAVVSLQLERARSADLLFAEWNTAGTILTPPVTERPSLPRLLTELKRRATGIKEPDSINQCVYQLQILSPTPRLPESANDAGSLRRLFCESLHVLRQRTTVVAGGAR